MDNRKMNEILKFLRPSGGFVLSGIDLEGVRWDNGTNPVTRKEFEDAIDTYELHLTEAEAEAAAKKAAAEAKLAALGLTADDLKALGLG